MNKSILKKVLNHPNKIITNLGRRGLLNWMSDEAYIKLLYFSVFKKFPNLKDPKTLNEKLQWLKLNDRRAEYTVMVDKYQVKKWVANKIGLAHVIPTIGVWDRFNEIDFDSLPKQFVLKCTHDSGSICICKNKAEFDKKVVKKKINKSLGRNFFWFGREWPYKDVTPRIIAEPYLTDESGIELKDYKIYNFNGIPKLIQVDYDRFTEHKRNLYSIDWKYIDATMQYPSDSARVIDKPKKLEEMLELAKKLSEGTTHVRTDFYVIGDSVYFGELTFYSESGFIQFVPKDFEEEVSSWLRLRGGYYLMLRILLIKLGIWEAPMMAFDS